MSCRRILTLILMVLFCLNANLMWAAGANDAPPAITVLGSIALKGGKILRDSRSQKEIEAIISELKNIDSESLVRIEGHAGTAKTKSEYITKSLNLAWEVERYLRIERHIKLDLYLAAMDDKIPSLNKHFVRIVVYPNTFKEKSGFTQINSQ